MEYNWSLVDNHTGNNTPEILLTNNQHDCVVMETRNGTLGTTIHFEFRERWKINALINSLTKHRDAVFDEKGILKSIKEKETNG